MIEISVYYPVGRRIDEPSSDKVRIEFVLPKRPFLFWSELHEAEAINFPRGYGIAWHDPVRARLLFAPMPFNIFVGFGIWLYHWARGNSANWLLKHSFLKDK